MKAKRQLHYFIPVVAVVIASCYLLNSHSGSKKQYPPICFEKEEKIHHHPLEWWYHFGFLKTDTVEDYEWAFFSSFTKSATGRNIMGDLVNLKTGKKYLFNELDITLAPIGLPPQNFTVIRDLKRISEHTGRPIDLMYGKSRFLKTGNCYLTHLENTGFDLSLIHVPSSQVMLMENTGRVGFPNPKSFYYYTIPRLRVKGELTIEGNKRSVEGECWYDHQWGNPLGYVNIGWCWWGLKLNNGDNLNIYRIRNLLTGTILKQVINIQDASGKLRFTSDAIFISHRTWQSPETKTSYPVEWTIHLPGEKKILHITPLVEDCESPILIYFYFWEGPCRVVMTDDTNENAITSGVGFQELVGFAIDKHLEKIK